MTSSPDWPEDVDHHGSCWCGVRVNHYHCANCGEPCAGMGHVHYAPDDDGSAEFTCRTDVGGSIW